MIVPLTYAVVGLSLLLLVAATFYAVRDRLIDDWVLGIAALLELALIVQLVTGLAGLNHIDDSTETATFAAYLVSLPVIPIGTAFLAIKEKSRWAMGSLAVGGFAVAVMAARLQQIWNANG
ncbi:MAG: hypothetical protein ABI249_02140 [Ornithinibacter sp.]